MLLIDDNNLFFLFCLELNFLFGFIFVRISPTLMILFSALNTGLGSVLEEHMPWIVVKMIFGIIIGVGALFLGRFIYFPYKRLQNISVKSF